MKLSQIIFVIFFAAFSSKEARAYPAYIGSGYASCLTCHYNPIGNGPINPYGRAVQATEMAGNLFGQDLESLADSSGFLYMTLPEWLQLQGSYRGLYLGRSLQAKPTTQWITMQAEASGTLIFSKQFLASGSIGYAPLPASLTAAQKKELGNVVSREHYLGFLPQKGWGIYAGLMDVTFGLRVPDHNAFIRSALLLNINDQTHGVLLHRDWEKGTLSIHAFLGRLFDDSHARQKGGSLVTEFEVGENFRIGGSLLYSTSDFRTRQMLATQTRVQMGKGSSLLGEVGLFHQDLFTPDKSVKTSTSGFFSFLQSRHLFAKGFYGLTTFETYVDSFKEGGNRIFRAGPSLEYLPFPKLEIRLDFFGTQVMGLTFITPSSYTAQVQTHVWL